MHDEGGGESHGMLDQERPAEGHGIWQMLQARTDMTRLVRGRSGLVDLCNFGDGVS